MRFKRLVLKNYGHFKSDYEIPFTKKGTADFHFIYGNNEAGKTTSLKALIDFMFGVQERTPYNFFGGELRIIAEVQGDGEPLYASRRKGRKNTLLDSQQAPLDDSRLSALFGGIGREQYERLYGLDHEKLRTGGELLLENSGDLGVTLFSAETGMDKIPQPQDLDIKAEDLWSPKGRSKKYHKYEKKYEEAKRNKRNTSTSVGEWERCKKALQDAQKLFSENQKELERQKICLSQWQRVSSVRPFLEQMEKLQVAIQSLEDVADFPDNAEKIASTSYEKIRQAKSHIKDLEKNIHQIRADIENNTPKIAIIDKEKEISGLAESRGEITKAKQDCPNLRRQSEALEKQYKELAQEIGLSENETLPSAAKIKSLQESATDIKNNKQKIIAAERNINQLTAETKTNGEVSETDKHLLWEKLENAHNNGLEYETTTEQQQKKKKLTTLAEEIERSLVSLTLWHGIADELVRLPLPLSMTVAKFAKRLENWEKNWEKLDESKKSGNYPFNS